MNERGDTEKLLDLIKEKGILPGEFTLSAGGKAFIFFDLKKILLWPEGAYLVGKKMFELIVDEGVKAVGGYGLGGCLIVTAVVAFSFLKGKPISGLEVVEREKLRQDDPQRYEDAKYVVKGHLSLSGDRVAIVDDVISTGRAIFIAIEVVESKGCQVTAIRTILDRQMGGSEELRRKGYNFKALLRADTSGNVYIN